MKSIFRNIKLKLPFILLLLFPVFLQAASAQIIITEIMYAPAQASDSDGEWIELYNNGESSVDLSSYTIDGADFDDIIIQPDEAIVVARELIDSSDSDTDSFETIYGNADGVWDENDADYNAVDGSFILNNEEDTILLSNNMETYEATYSSSMGADGNSLCLSYQNEEWLEQECSPGSYEIGESSDAESEDLLTEQEEITLTLEVQNSLPTVSAIMLNGIGVSEGEQIELLPDPETYTFPLQIELTDQNGYADIQSVTAILSNEEDSREQGLILIEGSEGYAEYATDFPLEGLFAGTYTLTLSIQDNQEEVSTEFAISYLPLIHLSLSTDTAQFSVQPGQSEEAQATLTNKGNINIETTLESSGLTSSLGTISAGSILVFFNSVWSSLSSKLELGMLAPMESSELIIRVSAPEFTKAGTYSGEIIVTAGEAE